MSKNRIIKVDEEFKHRLEKMKEKLGKRRGRDPSFPQLTAELAKNNFDEFMLRILGD